jgi:ATP-dependent DNA helicase RecG
LDISILNEMPKNRQKIMTQIVATNDRKKYYDFIRQEIKNGRQAFVVCPRIENTTENSQTTNSTDIKAVKEEYKKLSEEIFPDLKIAMLHGKLKPKEKEKIMADFKNNKTDILVATSVIEVGIDVPNATIMLIEEADRFGLAQLHQFRGRIGRGQHQSYCLLATNSEDKSNCERLKALVNSENGFQIAEYDLELRGPGQFLGKRQWGMPDMAFASFADVFLLQKVRDYASDLLNNDPELTEYPALKNRVINNQSKIHLE